MADREVEVVGLLPRPPVQLVAPVEAQGADRAIIKLLRERIFDDVPELRERVVDSWRNGRVHGASDRKFWPRRL